MIVIGCDHGGYELKQTIMDYLKSVGKEVCDCGTYSTDSVDYPDYAKLGTAKVLESDNNVGIFICGSGVGMSVCANRNPKIRAALCWSPAIAALARQHNNANVLVLPGRFIKKSKAIRIVKEFLTSQYEAGRHAKRLKKL